MTTTENEIWIFGYGSLMWSPGFDFVTSRPALLEGYHRDMCILSYVFRGTPNVPGLVMGLNQGGQCTGLAFQISPSDKNDVFEYLHEREMINNVYVPSWVKIRFEDGQTATAYTFVARNDHEQHVGDWAVSDKVDLVLQGRGKGGRSLEYLENCCLHLRELNIRDEALEDLLDRAQQKK